MAVRLSGIHLVVSRRVYLYQWLLLSLDRKPPHAPTTCMLPCSQGCLYLEYILSSDTHSHKPFPSIGSRRPLQQAARPP